MTTYLSTQLVSAAESATPEATGVLSLAWLLVALPLFGAAVLLLGGRRTDRWGHLLGVAMPVAAFVLALAQWACAARAAAPTTGRSRPRCTPGSTSARSTSTSGSSSTSSRCASCCSITFVGSLIHIYSVGYMEHDPDRRRFFGYLNLFVASMLLLVLANSYLVLYVGWEGVGLASYLLIGFWNYKPGLRRRPPRRPSSSTASATSGCPWPS